MGVGEESVQCPCCIECKDCEDFQKVAEIKDAGVVIFRHRINATDDVNKQSKVLQSSPTEDVFIFQNTRNVDIPSADLMPNLETFKISCRRCRKIYERAQKLLKRVPIIGEKHVMGICDHCYQNQFPNSCYECEKIVNKFLAARYGERDTKDTLRTWLSKMKHVLRDVTSYKMKTSEATSRANSELRIDKISQLDLRSPKKRKEKDNIMLVPEKRRSDSNIPDLLPHTPVYDTHGNIKGRLQSLDKSGFLDSMGGQLKYRPDQRNIGEALEAAARKQDKIGASDQRSIFEEPDRNLKQMRDNNIPTSLLYKSKGKPAEFLYPTIAQETHNADQGHTEEAFGVGKPAYSGFGASEPLSILDELDRKDIEELRASNTSYLYKSKHAKDEMIIHELDNYVEFKDSVKLRKKNRPVQRYIPGVEAAKQEQIAFGGKTVRPIFDEHSSIRLLPGEEPHKTTTQKLKLNMTVPKEKSETSVLHDQGLRIDQQSIKPIIKKTQAPIDTRLQNQLSTETIISTISRAAQDTLGKELTYFFPISDRKKLLKLKSTPNSATLIQDTQQKIEEEKLRKEAELVKKKQLAEEKAYLIAEKKRLAEEDEQKIHAEGREKISTKEVENNDNVKAIGNKQIIGWDETILLERGKIKNDGDRGTTEKNMDLNLEQGDKRTGKENENLAAQEQLKKEKEEQLRKKKTEKQSEKDSKETEKHKANEEQERQKKYKEEQLLKEKLEKELKETKKYKAKEEKELKGKEKLKLQPEGKKGKELTKHTDDIDSKSKPKREKDLQEKDRKKGIEEKDSKLKGKQFQDVSEEDRGLKQKQNQRSDKKGLELIGKVQLGSDVEQDGINLKRSGKNVQELGKRSKDIKLLQTEKAALPSVKKSKQDVGASSSKVDRKEQSDREKDGTHSKRSKNEKELEERSKDVIRSQTEKAELSSVKPSKPKDAPLSKVDRKEQSELEKDGTHSKISKIDKDLKEISKDVIRSHTENAELPSVKPSKPKDAPLSKEDRKKQSEREQDGIYSKTSGKPDDALLLKMDHQSEQIKDKPAQFNEMLNDSDKAQLAAPKKKIVPDAENKNDKELAGKKIKDVKFNTDDGNVVKKQATGAPEIMEVGKKFVTPKEKETPEELILRLVRLKQATPTPDVMKEVISIDPSKIKGHRNYISNDNEKEQAANKNAKELADDENLEKDQPVGVIPKVKEKKVSYDDLILRLVRLKQATPNPDVIKDVISIEPSKIKDHRKNIPIDSEKEQAKNKKAKQLSDYESSEKIQPIGAITKVKEIKVSYDDLISRLVRLKQATPTPGVLKKVLAIDPSKIKDHRKHISNDSEKEQLAESKKEVKNKNLKELDGEKHMEKKQPMDVIPKVKEINVNYDDLILKLVKVKQATPTPRVIKEVISIDPSKIKDHRKHISNYNKNNDSEKEQVVESKKEADNKTVKELAEYQNLENKQPMGVIPKVKEINVSYDDLISRLVRLKQATPTPGVIKEVLAIDPSKIKDHRKHISNDSEKKQVAESKKGAKNKNVNEFANDEHLEKEQPIGVYPIVNTIKVSYDDLILRLVRLKQATPTPRVIKEVLPMDLSKIKDHKQISNVNEREQLASSKNKKSLDAEYKNAAEPAGKKVKDAKFTADDGNEEKTQPISEIPKLKETKISHDDLILRLVKLKKATSNPRLIKEVLRIDPLIMRDHHRHITTKSTAGVLVIDSDLELEIESIELHASQKIQKAKHKICDIIIGANILKYASPLSRQKEEQALVPLVLQPVFEVTEPTHIPRKDIIHNIPEKTPSAGQALTTKKSSKEPDPEQTKGIMRYALSDRTFIDKGWTMLPTEKVVRKMNVYRMRPAQPEFDWFEHNRNKGLMLYDSGEKLAEFDDNGRGRWYYKNGHLALDYYDAEEINANQRFVLYSSGEPDERGRSHPITVLATFDYLGNGVVFDHAGKIRLKYNQTEGVVLDRALGPVSHWKWHTLNDPPVLQQVMIDTQMPHKDPNIIKLGGTTDKKTRNDNDEMLAIEFENFIKEKSKKLTQTFKPFQIKMKALKINEHFSLRVLDQASVYLIYRDGTTNLKLNIGMILDHKEIVDTDTAEVGDVSNSLERFPARTESIAGLQRSVAYAQRFERTRTERERRLRPLIECASVDRLAAASSRPLRIVPAGSTSGSRCNCRKASSSCQVYYNTRLT